MKFSYMGLKINHIGQKLTYIRLKLNYGLRLTYMGLKLISMGLEQTNMGTILSYRVSNNRLTFFIVDDRFWLIGRLSSVTHRYNRSPKCFQFRTFWHFFHKIMVSIVWPIWFSKINAHKPNKMLTLFRAEREVTKN